MATKLRPTFDQNRNVIMSIKCVYETDEANEWMNYVFFCSTKLIFRPSLIELLQGHNHVTTGKSF